MSTAGFAHTLLCPQLFKLDRVKYTEIQMAFVHNGVRVIAAAEIRSGQKCIRRRLHTRVGKPGILVGTSECKIRLEFHAFKSTTGAVVLA